MIEHEELARALHSVGAAVGWWFAYKYDPTRLRWLTLICALSYTLPAALRVIGLILVATT